MKRSAIVALAAALAIVVPVAVIAATGGGGSALDEQRFLFRDSPVSTSSTQWRKVPGLHPITICAINEVSLTMSVTLDGAPAGFRVMVDAVTDPIAFAHPGPIRIDPGDGGNAFTFNFARVVAPFEENNQHTFDLQWRSPTGQQVTLNRGLVNVLFERSLLGEGCAPA